MRFYQACFGKPNNVNWALFNYSNDIPANLSSFYEKAENSNTPQNLSNDDMIGRDGNPLCLYEILTQEGIVAVSRIQYGTRDNMGRPKMFAHGFLFDENEDILRNPNNILTISDDNFKFDTEETKQIPAELKMCNAYNLRDAMRECNIDESGLIKLMECIYVSLTSATDYPLYIISDNKDKVIRPLAYCIYTLLPYSLRYGISISNANNFTKAQFKSIMFVDKEYSNGHYFNLETFETSVDTSEVRTSAEKYPFIYKMSTIGIDAFDLYCDTLQEELEKMQLLGTREYNVVKLANTFLDGTDAVDNLDDQELTRFLLETISYAPMQNNYIDCFIAVIAEKYHERGLVPNEAMMRRLQVRAEKTPAEQFLNIYKLLQMKALTQSGTDAVVNFLGEQRTASWDRFAEWCNYLCDMEDGTTIIEKYYSLRINTGRTFLEILDTYEECTKVISFRPLCNLANSRCYDIARTRLTKGAITQTNYSDVLDEYLQIFTTINPTKSPVERQRNIESLIKEYWEQFDITDFEFDEDCILNCQCMEMETDTHTTYKNVRCLIDFYNYFTKNNYIGECSLKEIIPEVENFLKIFESECEFSREQLKNLVPKIQKVILKYLNVRGYNNCSFVFWFVVASFGYGAIRKNPYENMLKWELPVIMDDEAFEKSINSKRSKHYISELIVSLGGKEDGKGFIDKFDSKSEEFKLLKKRLNVMREIESDIRKKVKQEEVRARKEEARARKEEARAQKEELKKVKSKQREEIEVEILDLNENYKKYSLDKKDLEKKGLFSNLFGGSGKKKK